MVLENRDYFACPLIYDSQLRIVAELDGTNALVSQFVYATSGNVPDYMTRGGIRYRIIKDHLGSVRLVVNATTGQPPPSASNWKGGVTMAYDAFGNVVQGGAFVSGIPAFQPFGFAGGVYDYDTNLVRFGARDYDPEVGRWLSKDQTLFHGADTNLYGYAGGDPINAIDPTGLRVSFDGADLSSWWQQAKQADPGVARRLQSLEDAPDLDLVVTGTPMNDDEAQYVAQHGGGGTFNSSAYECTNLFNMRIVVDPTTAWDRLREAGLSFDGPAALAHEASHVLDYFFRGIRADEDAAVAFENAVHAGDFTPVRKHY